MPDDTQVDLGQSVAELRRELDTRTAERDESLAREAATAEILQVINSSPGDLAPVFDAMLEKALRFCEAGFYAATKHCNDAHNPKLEPSLRVTTRDLGAEAEIRVRDNGTGIPPEIKEKLFPPFFTTSRPAKAPGWVSRSAMTSSHSSMAARSRSTAARANSPNSRSACRVPGRAQPQG
jgi:signal transduction histidine kinase